MSDYKLRDLTQRALANALNHELDAIAEALCAVLDEEAKLRLIDSLERFIEKLRGPPPSTPQPSFQNPPFDI